MVKILMSKMKIIITLLIMKHLSIKLKSYLSLRRSMIEYLMLVLISRKAVFKIR
jgi:hypothetical protein